MRICLTIIFLWNNQSVLFSMDCPVMSVKQHNDNLTWNILLTHGVEWFDCKMIASLARVSKQYDPLLQQTAGCRKNYFIEYDSCLQQIKKTVGLESITWHKYGMLCGKKVIGHNSEWPLQPFGVRGNHFRMDEELIMHRKCLNGSSLCYAMWRGNCGDFRYLPHKPEAFFNEKGDYCCYVLYNGVGITECSLSADGNKKAIFCRGKIDTKKGEYDFDLSMLIEFPALLKACLDSLIFYNFYVYRLFDLKNVVIPENYREYKSFFSDIILYQSFDDLPKVFRKAIVALYNKQHKKKKKNGLLKLVCI